MRSRSKFTNKVLELVPESAHQLILSNFAREKGEDDGKEENEDAEDKGEDENEGQEGMLTSSTTRTNRAAKSKQKIRERRRMD